MPREFLQIRTNTLLAVQGTGLAIADIDGDGLPDIITGKRYWAHGPTGDPDSDGPAVLYWFGMKTNAAGDPIFVPHLIGSDSGVGTQIATGDLNGDGKVDIAVANKKGVFIYFQRSAAVR